MVDLLFELGTEDLPANLIRPLAENLMANVIAGLQAEKLAYGAQHVFGTPRRIAIRIENIAEHQADFIQERKGPALKQAFDARGLPTSACLGFAKSCGVNADVLEKVHSAHGDY